MGGYPVDAGDPVRRSYGSRRLNTSTDMASTVMAGRRFHVGNVRGKNDYLYGAAFVTKSVY